MEKEPGPSVLPGLGDFCFQKRRDRRRGGPTEKVPSQQAATKSEKSVPPAGPHRCRGEELEKSPRNTQDLWKSPEVGFVVVV